MTDESLSSASPPPPEESALSAVPLVTDATDATDAAPTPDASPEAPEASPYGAPPEGPTYQVEQWSGLTRYVCLIDGHEGWSLETFQQHMDVYHQGVMREGEAGPGPQESETSDTGTASALSLATPPVGEEGPPAATPETAAHER